MMRIPMIRRAAVHRLLVSAAACIALLATATMPLQLAGAATAPATTTSSTPAGGTISWATCPGNLEEPEQCGTLRVPISGTNPRGGSVTLALARHLATAPTGTPGVLLFNPGGPGESAVQILPVALSELPAAITKQMDVVVFDERGTGESSRLTCGPSPAQAAAVLPVPSRAGAPLPAARTFAGMAKACARQSPQLFPTVDTVDSAMDMDRVRQALGVAKISYYGLSYGTLLGALYARLFPNHVQSMVLDGAVDGTQPLMAQARQEAPAIQASLAHFFATCGGVHPCPLGAHPAAAFARLVRQLNARPLPAPGNGDDTSAPLRGDTPVTVGDLATATLYALSVPTFSNTFPPALSQALAGNGAPLRQLSEEFEVDLDGSSLVGPMWTITCHDSASRPSATASGTLARQLAKHYSLVAADAVTYTLGGCIGWPPATKAVTSLRVHGGPPLVVIGNTGDPNTPHTAAEALASQLGRGRLVTWDGWGHTWLLNGSTDSCMQQVVTQTLVDNHPPANGTVCH